MRSCYYKRITPTSTAIADLCDYYGKGMILTRINVPAAHRGQGHAREILQEILADADDTRTTLWLEIAPSDGLDYHQLKTWYERNGFKDIGGIFRRKPHTPHEQKV